MSDDRRLVRTALGIRVLGTSGARVSGRTWHHDQCDRRDHANHHPCRTADHDPILPQCWDEPGGSLCCGKTAGHADEHDHGHGRWNQ